MLRTSVSSVLITTSKHSAEMLYYVKLAEVLFENI